MFGILFDEAKKMIRDPKRVREVFRPRRWRQLFDILRFNAHAGNRWRPAEDAAGVRRREYSSYEEYVRHQQSKLGHLDLAEYDREYREQLRGRLRGLGGIKAGANVLCLGARQGTEVKAFHDLGCFAVGIDLNPGPENPLVLRGDFHAAQFPTGSVDILFTNSFDHAFDPARLIGEIKRLLKPGGMLIVEASRGEREAVTPDHYASVWWERIDDLVALLGRHDFMVVRRAAFSKPWPGEQIVAGSHASRV